MTGKNNFRNAWYMTRAGLFFFVVAALEWTFVGHNSPFSGRIIQGTAGFFFGLAIVFLIQGIRLKKRHSNFPDSPQCN